MTLQLDYIQMNSIMSAILEPGILLDAVRCSFPRVSGVSSDDTVHCSVLKLCCDLVVAKGSKAVSDG